MLLQRVQLMLKYGQKWLCAYQTRKRSKRARLIAFPWGFADPFQNPLHEVLSPRYRCGVAVDQDRAAGLQIWADRTLWTQFKHNQRSHNNELFGLRLCVYIDKQMAECVIGKKKTRRMRARASGPISTSTECGAGQCFQNRPSETAVRALRIWKCCRGRDQETMKKWWNSWTFINEGQEWRFQTKKA